MELQIIISKGGLYGDMKLVVVGLVVYNMNIGKTYVYTERGHLLCQRRIKASGIKSNR